MERWLGGHPIAVVIRLAVLSLLVGIVLAWFGLDVASLLRRLDELARRVSYMGVDALDVVLRWLLLGGAVVVPLWLIWRIVRLLTGAGRPRD